MPYQDALAKARQISIPNPIPRMQWALVVPRHAEAVKAVDGMRVQDEYQRAITEKGFGTIAARRQNILELGFTDAPTGILGSPAKRCWTTAHGCAGLPMNCPNGDLYDPSLNWGWASGWPVDSAGNKAFYDLLNANKDKPVRFFLNFHGFPGFAQYLISHAETAWEETVAKIEEAGGGLFFASGHSPTQDKMCHTAVRADVSVAQQALDTHVSYGQGWYIGSPDGEKMYFGWMLQ